VKFSGDKAGWYFFWAEELVGSTPNRISPAFEVIGQMGWVNSVGMCGGGDGWEYLACGDAADGNATGCLGCGLVFTAFGCGYVGLDALGFRHSEGE
jgi:hypothetical protein